MKKRLDYLLNNFKMFFGRLVPFFIPLAVTLLMNIVLYYIIGLQAFKVTMLDTLISNIVSIAITNIGFLLTTIAILLSVPNAGIVKHILSEENLAVFKRYFYLPLFSSIFLIINGLYISIYVNVNHLLSIKETYILLNLFSVFITSTAILFKGIFNVFTKVSRAPKEGGKPSEKLLFKPDVTKLDIHKHE